MLVLSITFLSTTLFSRHATGFNIIITDDVKHFLDSLEPKAREKIAYDMALSQKVENRQLLKKLDDTDLWEFRTHFDGEAYRVLAFEIPGKNTMVACHAFVKKTQKTPAVEIERGENARARYLRQHPSA